MTRFAPMERKALADLLLEVGPDAPTLCEGWTTRDLAAHLVVRLTRVDAAPGIMLPALAPHLKRVQDRIAHGDWPSLVQRVRRNPWWLLTLDEAMNRVEYYVHHEDVRRAQPGWRPRRLFPEFEQALWARVRLLGKLALAKTPAAITVSAPGYGSFTAGSKAARAASAEAPTVVDLVGAPGELIMFLMGRQDHANVELSGPEEITSRMRTARYGL